MADKFRKEIEIKVKGTKKAGSSVTSMLAKFGGVTAAIALVKKLSEEIVGMTKDAVDAQESTSKFLTVFSNEGLKANSALRILTDSYGLARDQATGLLADTGDLLTGFGFTQESALNLSLQVQELAVDLASFTNYSGGAEGASQALTKALLGERESVKALGISIQEADVKAQVLKQTQEGMTFETERQAKAYATLVLAQNQSKNAIGDFARTSDQAANQIRLAKNAVRDWRVEQGEKFIPITTKAAGVVREFFKRATETSLETTIRQLREMKVAEEDLSELKLANDLLKTSDALDKAEKRFEKAARKARRYTDAVTVDFAESFEVNEEKLKAAILRIQNERETLARREIALQKELSEAPDWNEIERYTIPLTQMLFYFGKLGQTQKEHMERTVDSYELEGSILKRQYTNLLQLSAYLREVNEVRSKHNELLEEEKEFLGANADNMAYMPTIIDETTDAYLDLLGVVPKVREENEESTKILFDYTEEFKKYRDEILKSAIATDDLELRLNFDEAETIKNYVAFLDAVEEGIIKGDSAERIQKAFAAQLFSVDMGELNTIDIPEADLSIDLTSDWEKAYDAINEYGNLATSTLSGVSQIWENLLERRHTQELKDLQESANYRIASTEKQRKLEEDLAAKQAEEMQRQAKFAKAVALMEVGVNTASAIMKSLTIDPTGTLAAINAGIGLIQAGVVASEPIPGYFQGGVIDGGEQIIRVNERGRESILNACATNRLGPEGVNALNSGAPLGNTIHNTLVIEVKELYGSKEYVNALAGQIVEQSNLGFNDLKVKGRQ